MKPIRIDFEKNEVIMTRRFAAAASDPHTVEYKMLQDVLNTYKGIHVRKHTIKKNANKETYKGLTYEYMENFIRLHEEGKKLERMLFELSEMQMIAKCHKSGVGYATIKRWFLDQYEDVEIFGANEERVKKIKARRAEEAAKKLQVVKTEDDSVA